MKKIKASNSTTHKNELISIVLKKKKKVVISLVAVHVERISDQVCPLALC